MAELWGPEMERENPCAVKPVYRKCFINTWKWKDRMVVVGDIVLWGGLLTYMAFILECLASIQQSSYPVNPLFVCFSVGGVRFAGNFPGSRQAGERGCGSERVWPGTPCPAAACPALARYALLQAVGSGWAVAGWPRVCRKVGLAACTGCGGWCACGALRLVV